MSDKQTKITNIQTQSNKDLILDGNCNIRDLKTFDAIAGNGHEIAGLYFYCMLDHLVDIAYEVAKDLTTNKFEVYRDDTIESSLNLLKLYTRMGNDEIFLSREHRHLIWHSYFGHTYHPGYNHSVKEEDKYSHNNFPTVLNRLLETATEFVTRAEIETGASALISSFRLALVPFNQYIFAIQTAAARLYRQQILPLLTEGNVYSILRNRAVTAVYGVNSPICCEWPYASDSTANVLIERISQQLSLKEHYGMSYSQIYQSYLELTARRGACAISAAIETDSDSSSNEDILNLINKFHSWHTALTYLQDYSRSEPSMPKNGGNANENGNLANGSQAVIGELIPANNRMMLSAAYRR
jgi:hypothetical protein